MRESTQILLKQLTAAISYENNMEVSCVLGGLSGQPYHPVARTAYLVTKVLIEDSVGGEPDGDALEAIEQVMLAIKDAPHYAGVQLEWMTSHIDRWLYEMNPQRFQRRSLQAALGFKDSFPDA